MKLHQKVSKKINDLYHTYSPILLPKSRLKVECPSCGWKGPSFLPNAGRANARCPKCDSKERHRLYYLYLKENIPTDQKIKVLHFAPEKILTSLFRSYKNIDYVSADLDPRKAMTQQDITNTSFENDTFDLIFCAHVLEHIPDDMKAMRELLRILKPGGLAILQVPIKDFFNGMAIDKTYEDPGITDPKERERVFGQHDHVRIYGRDFKDRLENAGFKVSVDNFGDRLGTELLNKFALLPDDPTSTDTEKWIYRCTK